MAEEYTKEKKHNEAVLRETPDVFRLSPPVTPKPAKYRVSHKGDKPGPELTVGMLVTVSVSRRDRIGYLLFEILDWDDEQDPGYWAYSSRIYGRVRAVSHSKLEHMVGRITGAKRYRQFGTGNAIVDWTPDAFNKTPNPNGLAK